MKKNNRNKAPFKIILTGVIIVLLLLPVAPRLKTMWELNQRIECLQDQKKQLQQVNRGLEEEFKQASSPAVVEKIAREQLGMVKEGESRIVEVLP